ncbi:hypothetical protein CJ030_MR3G027886 [Morella rubra]|uniref:HhH-GPD domain-containing protein n=1 Tax=Morella rubra TaxID=262757 RepID=A0A6A1W9S6_9ROSI|nr:hypothetical protein CJ030_MR3G027886 [Morella rubra]
MPSCLLQLQLEECVRTFNMEKAVCNHGFFMMAPNAWIPSTKTLQRPLRLANSAVSVLVSISHPASGTANYILIQVHDTDKVSPQDEKAILEQVARMLRISERDERNLREFQNLHPEAKEKGFGRCFRSPSLFEDAIKSLLLCNCTWTRTLDMAKALCELQWELANGLIPDKCENLARQYSRKRGLKRKQATRKQSKVKKCERNCSDNSQLPLKGKDCRPLGNFPSSKEVAMLNEYFLENHCNLGYRARYIVKLAKQVESGKLKLKEFDDDHSATCEELYEKLTKIKGFGPFACANVMMCMGYYQLVPVDTETVRHLRQVHGRKKETVHEDVKDVYDKHAPFQSLAYWFELLEHYERKFGKLSELPNSSYRIVSGSHS